MSPCSSAVREKRSASWRRGMTRVWPGLSGKASGRVSAVRPDRRAWAEAMRVQKGQAADEVMGACSIGGLSPCLASSPPQGHERASRTRHWSDGREGHRAAAGS